MVFDYLGIGAGLANIACAGDLSASGANVVLLDKGRGVGGRAATRRLRAPDTTSGAQHPAATVVDHGAQFFTARGERLQKIVDAGMANGWLLVWTYGFPLWKDGEIEVRPNGHPRYSPPGGMNELPKRLAEGLAVHTSITVVSVERDSEGGFVARDDSGGEWRGRKLLLNLPPAQLLSVAGAVLDDESRARVEAVSMAPVWAYVARLDSDIDARWSGLELSGHPVFSFVARDHTRRKPGSPPTLVAHATNAFTRANLEASPEDILPVLRTALVELVGKFSPVGEAAHRWRYAVPEIPLGDDFLLSPDGSWGACGDWCVGGRVEGALESGWKLAAALGDSR